MLVHRVRVEVEDGDSDVSKIQNGGTCRRIPRVEALGAKPPLGERHKIVRIILGY